MRTLNALLDETGVRVHAARQRHTHCAQLLEGATERIAQELMPQLGAIYTRNTDTESKLVHVVETQITDIVLDNYMRFRLDESVRPPPASLLVVQAGVYFYARYVTARDKLALPPFHLLASTHDWYSVCLGNEKCPDPQSLARVLATANFTSSYFQLVAFCEEMKVETIPHPFATWATAINVLKSGESVAGFTRIHEWTLEGRTP